jgi:hypothetical protein
VNLFEVRMGLDEDLWSAAECNDISTVSFPLLFPPFSFFFENASFRGEYGAG